MNVLDLVGRPADSAGPLRAASAFKHYGSAARDGIDRLAAAGALLFERRDLR
jgi:hypothetical protein